MPLWGIGSDVFLKSLNSFQVVSNAAASLVRRRPERQATIWLILATRHLQWCDHTAPVQGEWTIGLQFRGKRKPGPLRRYMTTSVRSHSLHLVPSLTGPHSNVYIIDKG